MKAALSKPPLALQGIFSKALRSNTGRFLAALALLMAITLSVAANHQNLPPGVYTTTITLDDVPAAFPFPPEALVGQWQVEFTEAGSVIVSKDGDIAVVGHYTSDSSHLEITDVLGDYACALVDEPGAETGSYSWTLDDGELTLTAEADLCEGRPVILASYPLVAMGSSSSGPLLTSWPSEEDPGGPYYVRTDDLPPYVFHDDDYAAIIFYRGPEGIPEDFNLLAFFDPPTGPDTPGAFGVPLNVSGTHLWNEEVWVGAPRMVNMQGLGAVPIWFVPTAPLLALIDASDQALTMADLLGMEGVRVGSATHFQEVLHPHASPAEMGGGGGHPRPYLSITARGTLEDGGRFTLNISKQERQAGTQRMTSIRFQ